MDSWFGIPVKIFVTGILLAVVGAFIWRSVEIQYVQQSAIVAAHSAVSNPSTPAQSAQASANAVLQNAKASAPVQLPNNIVQTTVSYQPQDIASKVFSYLGIQSPNQKIVMTGTAPGTLDTLNLSVPKSMTAGSKIVLSGNLEDGTGALVTSATGISITLKASDGTLGSSGATTQTVTTTTGNFSFTYTAPNAVKTVELTLSGNNITTSSSISIVPTLTITSPNPAIGYVGQPVTVQGTLKAGTTALANQTVVLSSDPNVTFSPSTITTDANGNFTATFTDNSPSIINIVGQSDGAVSDPPFAIQILAGNVNFDQSSYSIGVGNAITITGNVTVNGSSVTNQPTFTVQTVGSNSLGTISTPSGTTLSSNGTFSFTFTAGNVAGAQSVQVQSDGGTSTISVFVQPAKVQFMDSTYSNVINNYSIGVGQTLPVYGEVTSLLSNGNYGVYSGISSLTLGVTRGSFQIVPSSNIDLNVPVTNGKFTATYVAKDSLGQFSNFTGNGSWTDTLSATGTSLTTSTDTVTVSPAVVTLSANPTNLIANQTTPNPTSALQGQVESNSSTGVLTNVTNAPVSITTTPSASGTLNPVSPLTTSSSGYTTTFTTATNTTGNVSFQASSLGGNATTSLSVNNFTVSLSFESNGTLVDPSNIASGSNLSLVAKVESKGTPVSGQSVSIITSTDSDITTGTAGVTNTYGETVLPVTLQTTGTYTVTVEVNNNSNLESSLTFTVNPVITSVSSNATTWGPTFTIQGNGFGSSSGNVEIFDTTNNFWVDNNASGPVGSMPNVGQTVTNPFSTTWGNTTISTNALSDPSYGVGTTNGKVDFQPNDKLIVYVADSQGDTIEYPYTYPSSSAMPSFGALSFQANGSTITPTSFSGTSDAVSINQGQSLTISGTTTLGTSSTPVDGLSVLGSATTIPTNAGTLSGLPYTESANSNAFSFTFTAPSTLSGTENETLTLTLPSNPSVSFTIDVTMNSYQITNMTASPSTISLNQYSTISGTLSEGGTPVSNASVQMSVPSGSGAFYSELPTSSNGAVSLSSLISPYGNAGVVFYNPVDQVFYVGGGDSGTVDIVSAKTGLVIGSFNMPIGNVVDGEEGSNTWCTYYNGYIYMYAINTTTTSGYNEILVINAITNQVVHNFQIASTGGSGSVLATNNMLFVLCGNVLYTYSLANPASPTASAYFSLPSYGSYDNVSMVYDPQDNTLFFGSFDNLFSFNLTSGNTLPLPSFKFPVSNTF